MATLEHGGCIVTCYWPTDCFLTRYRSIDCHNMLQADRLFPNTLLADRLCHNMLLADRLFSNTLLVDRLCHNLLLDSTGPTGCVVTCYRPTNCFLTCYWPTYCVVTCNLDSTGPRDCFLTCYWPTDCFLTCYWPTYCFLTCYWPTDCHNMQPKFNDTKGCFRITAEMLYIPNVQHIWHRLCCYTTPACLLTCLVRRKETTARRCCVQLCTGYIVLLSTCDQ
jgi:hypothetical protein